MQNISLAELKKVLLAQLHKKLGLMKNIVKALNTDGNALKYLKHIDHKLRDAKLKERREINH